MREWHHAVKVALGLVGLIGAMALPSAPRAFAQGNSSIMVLPNNANASKHGKLLGHADANKKVSVTISLHLRNADKVDGFIADLYNPSSPNYKHFLTPQQFAQMFGPSSDTINQVTHYFTSKGLHVDSVSPERTLIQVSGTVAQVERAFGVTMNNYQNAEGHQYYANANNPQLPSDIADVVTGITGLDNEPHWRHAAQGRQSSPHVSGKPNTEASHVGSGPAGGYTPSELRAAYDVNPLNSGGTNGSGQTVALFELDGYVKSNITTYDNYYSLGSPAPTNVLVDGYNGAAGQGEGEVELDIEVINAMAPKANVTVYEGPNSDQGVIDTYQKIASDDKAKQVSVSWGLSELQSSASTMNSMHTIFQQMATQGQSVFAASGDSGAYDGGDTQLAVDSPANDPYVTGVGGTHLTLSGGSYGSESVWSNSTNKTGGGGGLSTVYSQPSWQTGTGVQNSYSNGKREVPDVSADADPNTGYSIYSAGQWVVYGGTSCAAPLWAGLAALNNQYAEANGKADLGYANPTLYKMFNTTQTYPAYHDVTQGNNLYYPATAGYDMASGIGTPDAYNLVRDLNGGSSGGGGGGGGGGTQTQLLSNGGFENGKTPWVESSSGGYELIDTTYPHTGSYSAYLAGYNNGTDTIYQTISVPSTAKTVTLTYWTDVDTTETTHSYDYLYVQVRNASGTVLKTLQTQSDGTAAGWRSQSFDLGAYKGQTIQIAFKATNDYSNPTSFFVDDVSVTAQ
ncbi:protease pro-enzyme activation domain-containing protein [Alicyclobacillus pomorum]|uniref:protease pro-enzyme activation domain-containing protein n=1 Tax=Alicyclobacillus pomorum TaxID=204470 RepID=UPI00042A156D|nr:protease pro-enzyme activation domain-containing protein [Alicyclobacillus pomorum]